MALSDLLAPHTKPSDGTWKFYPSRKGKKRSIWDCFYCGLLSEKVECAGMYYCPNPLCAGPGGAWFRRKLLSYKESGNGGHTVDELEWKMAAKAYNAIKEYEAKFKKWSNE